MKTINLRAILTLEMICLIAMNCNSQEKPGRSFRYELSGIRFLQVNNVSDRPCFQFNANIISPDNKPIEFKTQIDLSDELADRTTILYQNSPINKSNILIEAGNKIAKRYTIILIDHSGTMLNRIGQNRTKFASSMSAALKFAENFNDNIDNMVIIPFSTQNVRDKIYQTGFMKSKADFRAQVSKINVPEGSNDTGLYSAIYYAIQRLIQVKKSSSELIEPDCLLIVLTDGINDLGNNYQNGLMKSPDVTLKLIETAGIDVTTIGFGSTQNLNEDILRKLARPNQARYFNANDTSQLNNAFILTRKYQLEKLRITFIATEKSNTQIFDSRAIKISSDFNGEIVTGELSWKPTQSLVPKFDGTLEKSAYEKLLARINRVEREKRFSFYSTLLMVSITFIIILIFLWRRIPNKWWKKEIDNEILENRIMPVRDVIMK